MKARSYSHTGTAAFQTQVVSALQLAGSANDVQATAVNLTRFLCGVRAPLYGKHKLLREKSFGALEGYPFADVLERVSGSVALPSASPERFSNGRGAGSGT